MELKHELLEVLEKAKQGTTSAFVKYLQDKDHIELLADIEALLAIQRQECVIKIKETLSENGFIDDDLNDEDYFNSTLNAKLF